MSNKHHGSCLCGSVRFEVAGQFERFFLCHCEYCRKDTGSAHAANLFASSAVLTWLTGQEQVKRFDLTGTRHSRAFCSNCGSALPTVQNGELLVVPAGSLDSAIRLRPDAHLFMASKAAWDEGLEQVPRVERLPS